MRNWTVLALVLAAVPALAQPEPAPDAPPPAEATQRVLIDRTLAQRPVRLISISADTVELIDPLGRAVSMPRNQVLALVPPLAELDLPVIEERILNLKLPESEKARIYGRLDLVDGQTLPGTLSASTGEAKPAKGDQIAWMSKLFGLFSMPMDNVSTMILVPDKADLLHTGAAPAQDTVVLLNEDRTDGFISAVDSSVRLEKGGKVSTLPIARVAAIQFANPAKPGRGAWVWLYDGTAAAVSQLTVDSSGHAAITGRLAGVQNQPTVAMDANDLRAICFDSGAVRPLSAAPSTVNEAPAAPGQPPRRWTPPLKIADAHGAPLAAADIEFPGPMTVEWTLPAGATRLGATAELPPSARIWGDCELIVESISGSKATQLVKTHLNASAPVAEIAVSLKGATKLRMTIDPGPSGPIQDRVVLRRPILLIAP